MRKQTQANSHQYETPQQQCYKQRCTICMISDRSLKYPLTSNRFFDISAHSRKNMIWGVSRAHNVNQNANILPPLIRYSIHPHRPGVFVAVWNRIWRTQVWLHKHASLESTHGHFQVRLAKPTHITAQLFISEFIIISHILLYSRFGRTKLTLTTVLVTRSFHLNHS